MTSTMSVSRIPVPVRNFDDTTRHRTVSAKTRLERLRDEFQRKLLFEKQAKLHDFYTQKERSKIKNATSRQIGSGEIGHDRYRNREVKANLFVGRDAFMNSQHNGYASSNNNLPNYSSRVRKRPPLPPYPKRSAGRDRAHLLAPINPARPSQDSSETRELQETETMSCAPSPDYLGDTYTLRKPNFETAEQKLAPRPPPIVNRPKIMRPYVRNRTHQVQFQGDSEGRGEGQFDQPNLERLKQAKLRRLNEEVSDESSPSLRNLGQRAVSSPGNEGLPMKEQGTSEFQKWQTEQHQERARRLQRLNDKSRNQAGMSFHDENENGDGIGKEPEKKLGELHVEDDSEDNDDEDNDNEEKDNGDNEDSEREDPMWRQKQQVLQHHNRKETVLKAKVSDDEEDLEDVKLKQKERELQELIRRQEGELQKLRLEKFEDDGEEKRKEIQNKNRQAKFLQQKQQILEAENLQQKTRHDLRTPPVDKTSETTPLQKTPKSKPTRRTSVASLPPKQTWAPEIDPNNEETAFYLQKAISEGNRGADEVKLLPCQVCGRSFASNRLAKHQKICSKESKKKKRKVFDQVAMRYRGTDFENHVKRRDSVAEEPGDEKNSHWRSKHQSFIDNIKYAKKVAKVESEGGNVSTLPRPPVTVNPDYVQCPHCQRRFNKNAADRHIPWCLDSKSRQPPMPKGRRQ